MVISCIAYGCKNKQVAGNPNLTIRFHRFPLRRPDILKKWILAVRRDKWKPTIYSRICSEHFTKDSYQIKSDIKQSRLKPDAIPSIFKFPSNLQTKKNERPFLKRRHIRNISTSMAECFSKPGVFATSPVYVLSEIPTLTEHLKQKALPGIQIKSISLPTTNSEVLNNRESIALKDVEILVCDPNLFIHKYKEMPSLKWVHSTWAGVEKILEAIPNKPPFEVTRHGGDVFSSLIAEYVICHILNYERKFKLCSKAQDSKLWLYSELSAYRTLSELTIGFLGVGNMAIGIAKFLKTRGTILMGFARTIRPQSKDSLFDNISTKLEDILPNCDYIVNTLPSTPATKGLLNGDILKMGIKKPVFINVGRGDIIDENDLVKALRNEWLSGAILDVFGKEPLDHSSVLWAMPQVTITPHVSALSRPKDVAEYFFDIFMNYIDGHELKNVVNWSAGY